MTKFHGFPEGKIRFTPIPAPFFSDLLPVIDHLGELKVTLYALWRLDHMEGAFRYLRQADFAADSRFMQGLGGSPEQAQAALDEALELAVRRTSLLRASLQVGDEKQDFFFLNSPKGRAAVQAIQRGEWRPSDDVHLPVALDLERPNIYRLYEENIGPLTPLIADALRDAENSFSEAWIEEAIQIAVENNKRNWRYVSAILDRWQTEGRDEPKDRRDSEKARRRYIEGEFSDYIEH